MNPYFVTDIVTQDSIVHQGLYFEPKIKSRIAVVWIHGLSGTCFSSLSQYEALIPLLINNGIGLAAFNNRGSGFLSSLHKKDPGDPKGYVYVPGGAGQERFAECIFDIDAAISFLEAQGYSKIILAGKSTGANKACFYEGTRHDPRVAGIILVSPISDRLEMIKTDPLLHEKIARMHKYIQDGKGDELCVGEFFFPLTPKRFISLFDKDSQEDVFDYGDKNSALTVFSAITKPLLVVFGECDEHADRPMPDIKKIFDAKAAAAVYKSIIVSGATHGFDGKERELAAIVAAWIAQMA